MKTRKPIKRSGKPIARRNAARKTYLKQKPRKPSETLRIYGPPARRKWMKTLPCSACGVIGYSEGAHVLGNGGTGRKADADTQAPLCGLRFAYTTGMMGTAWLNTGCHRLYDEQRWRFDERFPGYDPVKAAADCKAAWLLEESA